jgi:hypothetical protein
MFQQPSVEELHHLVRGKDPKFLFHFFQTASRRMQLVLGLGFWFQTSFFQSLNQMGH